MIKITTINGILMATQHDFNEHAENKTAHVTGEERTAWNAKADSSELASKVNASAFEAHKTNTSVHITPEERNRWNSFPEVDASGNMILNGNLTLGKSLAAKNAPNAWSSGIGSILNDCFTLNNGFSGNLIPYYNHGGAWSTPPTFHEHPSYGMVELVGSVDAATLETNQAWMSINYGRNAEPGVRDLIGNDAANDMIFFAVRFGLLGGTETEGNGEYYFTFGSNNLYNGVSNLANRVILRLSYSSTRSPKCKFWWEIYKGNALSYSSNPEELDYPFIAQETMNTLIFKLKYDSTASNATLGMSLIQHGGKTPNNSPILSGTMDDIIVAKTIFPNWDYINSSVSVGFSPKSTGAEPLTDQTCRLQLFGTKCYPSWTSIPGFNSIRDWACK